MHVCSNLASFRVLKVVRRGCHPPRGNDATHRNRCTYTRKLNETNRVFSPCVSACHAPCSSDDAAAQREEWDVVRHVHRAGAVHAGGDAHAVPAAQLGAALCAGARPNWGDGIQRRGERVSAAAKFSLLLLLLRFQELLCYVEINPTCGLVVLRWIVRSFLYVRVR